MCRTPALPLLLITISVVVAGTLTEVEGQNAVPANNVLPAATGASTGIVFSRFVNEVSLAFTVTNKKGQFVSDLNPEDFSVLDNRLPPASLKYFQRQSDLPIRVALVVDASDSTRDRFEYEQRAACLFLKRVLRRGKDQALVIKIVARPEVAKDLTDDLKGLSKSIHQIKPGGDTALYDSIVLASDKLQGGPPGTRRAVIVLTDGVDTASRATLEQAEHAAQRAEVTLFGLSTNDLALDRHPRGDDILRSLSEPTGGDLLSARNEDALLSSFSRVEKTLRNQYALAYEPSEFTPDGSYRSIAIATLKRGLQVKCRRGYFARHQDAAEPASSTTTQAAAGR
jgi:Ca-activated chloride channel family protein